MAKDKRKTFRVLNRGLVDVPVWEDHRRAKNWAAIVSPDPLAPGGLKRWWFQQTRGAAAALFKYLVPEQLDLYDVVEFGADYVAYSGNRQPKRWYGVVVDISPTAIVLYECETAITAFWPAEQAKNPVPEPPAATVAAPEVPVAPAAVPQPAEEPVKPQ